MKRCSEFLVFLGVVAVALTFSTPLFATPARAPSPKVVATEALPKVKTPKTPPKNDVPVVSQPSPAKANREKMQAVMQQRGVEQEKAMQEHRKRRDDQRRKALDAGKKGVTKH